MTGTRPDAMRILITGSEGLIGRHLAAVLEAEGFEVVRFDLRLDDAEGRPLDTRHRDLVERAIAGCDGVVHLAALSRVVWGERDPDACTQINVEGTRNVYDAVMAASPRPFVIFGSSREVYGLPDRLPVDEDAPLRPCNVYGRSKVEGERLTEALSDAGVRTSILRFSNVYGWTGDHPDRVVPAFAREAAVGGAIHVDGSDCLFDFTHIDDVVPALRRTMNLLAEGRRLPALHLVSGIGTTLGELGRMARDASGGQLDVSEMPPRDFDVARFVGDPVRAAEHVGWTPKTDLASGFAALVAAFVRQETVREPQAPPRSAVRA